MLGILKLEYIIHSIISLKPEYIIHSCSAKYIIHSLTRVYYIFYKPEYIIHIIGQVLDYEETQPSIRPGSTNSENQKVLTTKASFILLFLYHFHI